MGINYIIHLKVQLAELTEVSNTGLITSFFPQNVYYVGGKWANPLFFFTIVCFVLQFDTLNSFYNHYVPLKTYQKLALTSHIGL